MSRKTRKLIWSAPLVAVLAVAGALAIFVALAPNQAQADGAPGAVTGLKGVADGRSMINLRWTAPSMGTVTGYRIDRSDDGREWTLRKDDTDDAMTSYTDTGLKASTTYYYRVYALNGEHTGPVSISPIYVAVRTGAPVMPGQATGLMATKDLSKKITLTWNQPVDNGGSDVTRYCVQLREVNPLGAFPQLTNTNCGASTAATAAANIETLNDDAAAEGGVVVVLASAVEDDDDGTASWTHEMLADSLTVDYRVTAVNARGRSNNSSNTAQGMTAGTATPGMPMNIKLVGVDGAGDNTNTIYLYWNKPKNATTTIQVQRQVFVDGTGWSPALWPDPAVEANRIAAGTNDNHSQFADTGEAYGADDAFVSADRGEGRVRYRVRYVDGSTGGNWAYSEELDLPFPQAIAVGGDADVTALPLITATADDGADGLLRVVDDMKYFNRIDLKWMRQMFCSVGDVAEADGGDADTDCDDMSTTSTFAIDVASGTIEATDDADGDGNKWDQATATISFSEALYKHLSNPNKDDATKLVSDETRTYRVFPWHGGRYGFPAIATGMTKQASPPGGIAKDGLRVTADGDTKLKLDWDAPATHGGSPVTHYLIQVNTDRDDNKQLSSNALTNWCDVKLQKVDDGRMYTYTGKVTKTTAPCAAETLEGGDLRWFRVIPLNKKTMVPPTDAAAGWTVIADADGFPIPTDAGAMYQSSVDTALNAYGMTGTSVAPTAPIGLVAETAKNVHSILTTQKGVLLTWDKPAMGAVSTYVIDRKIDGGDWMTIKGDANPTSTDYTDPRIPTATEQFAYRIAAKNQYGTSAWSNMAYFSGTDDLTMPGHTHAPITLTAPVLKATAGTGSVTLMWDEQAAAVEYTVWGVRSDGSAVRSGSTEALIRVNDVTATTYTVMDLMNGEDYWFAVTACEMADCGAGKYLHSNVVVETTN